MKKSICAALLGASLALSTTVAGAPAAHAAKNEPCATKAEYRQVKKGMTPDKVAKIVGSKGKTTYTSSYSLSKEWKVCDSQFGFLMVDFMKGESKKLPNKKTVFYKSFAG